MSKPRAMIRNYGDHCDGVYVLRASGEYYHAQGYLGTGLPSEWNTPIPEWADAKHGPAHPPEYVMARRAGR